MNTAKILLLSNRKEIREFFKKNCTDYTILATSEFSAAVNILLKEQLQLIIVDWESDFNDKTAALLNLQKYNQLADLILLYEKMDETLATAATWARCQLLNYTSQPAELLPQLETILNRKFMELENKKMMERIEFRYAWGDFVGRGNYYNLIIGKTEECCKTKEPVLIVGETGTEKEIIAYEIYKNSPDLSGKFIKKILAPGALDDISFIYQAQNGCLFLEDVAELSSEDQQKLKGLLAENIAAFRLILCASNPLENKVKSGGFDEELYRQIAAYEINLLPLRERIKDLPDILDNLLTIINETNNFAITNISDEALIMLSRYVWPGNIAQLRAVISAICYRKRQGEIEAADLPLALRQIEPGALLANFEKQAHQQ